MARNLQFGKRVKKHVDSEKMYWCVGLHNFPNASNFLIKLIIFNIDKLII